MLASTIELIYDCIISQQMGGVECLEQRRC